MEKMSTEGKAIVSGVVVVVVALMLTISGFVLFEKIDNGNVGIEYSMNGGVKKQTLSQGVKFVGFNKVTQYPVRLQTVKAKRLNLATKDGKATHVSITYSYKVDPTKVTSIYKEFGSIPVTDIESGWLKSQLLKSGRNVMAEYSLLEVTGKDSTKVQNAILVDFQKAAKNKGFLIEDLSFGVPDVDEKTKDSIDAIIKAGQDNDRAKLEAETKQTKANANAKAKIVDAEGEAKANIATAKGEAKANKLISDSVTDNLIREKEAQARVKHGWVTTQGVSGVITK